MSKDEDDNAYLSQVFNQYINLKGRPNSINPIKADPADLFNYQQEAQLLLSRLTTIEEFRRLNP